MENNPFFKTHLPDKWCIRGKNQKEHAAIREYAEEVYSTKKGAYSVWPFHLALYFHFPKHNLWCTSEIIEEGYIEISFEEFEKLVERKPRAEYTYNEGPDEQYSEVQVRDIVYRNKEYFKEITILKDKLKQSEEVYFKQKNQIEDLVEKVRLWETNFSSVFLELQKERENTETFRQALLQKWSKKEDGTNSEEHY